MERKRYKSKAEVMAERIRAGLCDTCGGKVVELPMHNRVARLCGNGGMCGFHEVGKRDGAIFIEGTPGARRRGMSKDSGEE